MTRKIFHFDVETTGLDPKKNDIIQLAYLIEIGGVEKEEGNIFIQPFDYSSINPQALKVNNITIEQLKNFQDPGEAYRDLCKTLSRYIDKYDRADKFQPAGYNVGFDCDFFKEWFLKNGDVYYGSWFNWKQIDPLRVLYFLDGMGEISLPDYKLETVCEHFGIQIKAHEALSDIKATKKLIEILSKLFIKESEAKNNE
jgi:DNA polymerase-3 subunit epsilon